MSAPHAHHWTLQNDLTFLNHGSFGACPKVVLDVQSALRSRIEAQPVQFYARDLYDLIDEARRPLASFLDADSSDIVFIKNATEGVNSILRSLRFEPGDELLVTDHGYPACRNIIEFIAKRWSARVVVAKCPFPGADFDRFEDAILSAVTSKTKLALIDHVTSPTGLVLPIERLVPQLEERGVPTLVDGAHGPGMLDLSLRQLNPSWYVANCHKWICAPKGAGVLFARRDRQTGLHPACISHGYGLASDMPERSPLQLEFDWTGTHDPTPWLCVPTALKFMATLLPGGWPALRQRNRDLVLQGRDLLANTLGIAAPSSDEMIGHLAALPLPDADLDDRPSPLYGTKLQDTLVKDFRIEVPIVPWPSHPRRLLRISAAAYNELGDYERLATAIRELKLCW